MKKKWIPFFLLLLILDIATKIGAIEGIPPFQYGAYPFGGIGLFSWGGVSCSLNFTVNSGAAIGLFAGYPGLLFAIRAAIIAILIFFIPKRFSIWLILTGAVGNAIDYCLYGHVIDFIHFHFWGWSFPIFNVADSCISIGMLSLLLLPRKTKEAQAL